MLIFVIPNWKQKSIDRLNFFVFFFFYWYDFILRYTGSLLNNIATTFQPGNIYSRKTNVSNWIHFERFRLIRLSIVNNESIYWFIKWKFTNAVAKFKLIKIDNRSFFSFIRSQAVCEYLIIIIISITEKENVYYLQSIESWSTAFNCVCWVESVDYNLITVS